MAHHLLWTPTAETFAHHQLAQVMNFWKLGHPAKFHLDVKSGGISELVLTFQLPSPSEPIPPPYVVPEQVPHPSSPSSTGRSSDCLKKANYSRVKRRLRRAAERTAAAAEKDATEKTLAEKEAPVKAATDKEAAKVVAEKIGAENAAAEKVAKNEAAEKNAEKATAKEVDADKVSAEKISAEKAVAKKVATEKVVAEKVAAGKATAKKELAVKESAAASTSSCGSEQRASLPCWSCDKMFPVDNQGYIPEHLCAKDFPIRSSPVKPGPSAPVVLKKQVRMLDGSPIWSPRAKQ